MIAVDTNIIARLIVRDDEAQFARAKAVLEEPEVFVSLTVMLETAWLLRKRYGVSAPDVLEALTAVRRMPNVKVQDAERFDQAIAWARGGLQFEDALHLTAAADCDRLVSFDRTFIRRANTLGVRPSVTEP